MLQMKIRRWWLAHWADRRRDYQLIIGEPTPLTYGRRLAEDNRSKNRCSTKRIAFGYRGRITSPCLCPRAIGERRLRGF